MSPRRRRSRQLPLVFRTWGGARKNAGRKPLGRRAGVPHVPRGALGGRAPVHVTLRVQRGLPSLRSQVCFAELRRAFAAGKQRFGLRLVHYSVQGDHIHLLVEATHTLSLARGMQGLGIRMARGVNRALHRTGRVFTERYHANPLGSPRQVRNALVYVLRNGSKHDVQAGGRITSAFDPCSSAHLFRGWRRPAREPPTDDEADPPVAAARTWLLTRGWRMRLGPIGSMEQPRI